MVIVKSDRQRKTSPFRARDLSIYLIRHGLVLFVDGKVVEEKSLPAEGKRRGEARPQVTIVSRPVYRPSLVLFSRAPLSVSARSLVVDLVEKNTCRYSVAALCESPHAPTPAHTPRRNVMALAAAKEELPPPIQTSDAGAFSGKRETAIRGIVAPSCSASSMVFP